MSSILTPHRPERRAHPRAKANLPITIGAGGRQIEARVRDLSRSGICFVSPKPISEMTAVRINMEIPGARAHAVTAEGAVVRCEPAGDEYEVAIFFTALSDGDRHALDQFVAAGK
ncbi:MAG: PilZ domain-containing protein [Planctomycetes bacterium]|nr:PilZ domain-containing protein [Planctomycetota bacterium]